MADTPSERGFTDREVREILRRAVEDSPSGDAAGRHTVTLADLEEIGREVGIDPARLEAAARAVAGEGGADPGHRLLGVPTMLRAERRVAGAIDLSARAAEIASVVRRTTGKNGAVAPVGDAVEWSVTGEGVERSVVVSTSGGTVRVEGVTNLSNAVRASWTSGGVTAAMLTVIGVVLGVEEGVEVTLAALALLPVGWLALRTLLGRKAASESARLDRVVDEVARLVESGRDGDVAEGDGPT